MEIASKPGERAGVGRVAATPGSTQGGCMNYLFASYTVIWLLLFAYVISIARRQKKVQDDLSQIQEWMDRQKK
jgi:CcmD family protein